MKFSCSQLLFLSTFTTLLAIASVPASAKTVKECNAEYAANKDAIKGAGQKKKDFVEACRAGTETIPSAAAAAPTAPTTPAPPTVPQVAPPGAPSAPAAAPAAPVTRPAPSASPTASGSVGGYGYTGDAAAKAHCPTDTVVWVNTKSKIYHFAGTHNYGTTKSGTYMCEAEAKAAGDRAAENEKHP